MTEIILVGAGGCMRELAWQIMESNRIEEKWKIVGYVDRFLELSCFFDDPTDVSNLISGSSAFSKTSLNIRNFIVHILLKPGLENFEHYFTSV